MVGLFSMGRFLLLLAGVFFCATSVIIMRLSELPSALLATYRLLFAAVLLAPMFIVKYRQHRERFEPKLFWRCVPPGALLAVHFISWAWGGRMTFSTNATLIINLTPVVMPLLAHFLIREPVTRREILGTAIALLGVATLSADSVKLEPQYFWGDVICFGSMFTFAAYLAYGRVNKNFPSIWLYMVPIYAIASALCFVYSLITLPAVGLGSWEEAGWMLAMAVFPTMLGHITLNKSLQYFGAQTLAVVNVHQFVFAGAMAWMIFDEVPRLAFYLAAALCISGAVIIVRESARLRAAAKR